MKKGICLLIAVLLCLSVGMTSALATVYTGTGLSLPKGQELCPVFETKATTNRYTAVNTGEGYPNPGQLIGPTYLTWSVEAFASWPVWRATIGKNSRSSKAIPVDMLVTGEDFYLWMYNQSSVNATYGLTFTADATS